MRYRKTAVRLRQPSNPGLGAVRSLTAYGRYPIVPVSSLGYSDGRVLRVRCERPSRGGRPFLRRCSSAGRADGSGFRPAASPGGVAQGCEHHLGHRPSKTADVEGNLIEGVHGPRVQVALLVE